MMQIDIDKLIEKLDKLADLKYKSAVERDDKYMLGKAHAYGIVADMLKLYKEENKNG